MEEQKPKKHRIGMLAIVVFVVAAIICDLIGLIPFAKNATATVFWGISSFAMWKMGLGIFNGRKVAIMAVSWVSSMIPFIQEIPIEITAGIIAIIIVSRIEEKTGISALSLMNKGIMPGPLNARGSRLPASPKLPLNEGGQRQPNGGLTSTKTQMMDIKPPKNETSKIVNLHPPESDDLAMAA